MAAEYSSMQLDCRSTELYNTHNMRIIITGINGNLTSKKPVINNFDVKEDTKKRQTGQLNIKTLRPLSFAK